MRPSYAFGRFSMFLGERRLECDGEPARIGARAFDLLAVLVENAGTTVSKQVIWQRVWPGIHVGEGSLRFQLFELRRLLGERGMRNAVVAVPGRGYCFTATVRALVVDEALQGTGERLMKLPQPLKRMIGREPDLAAIKRLLADKRIVTLVGPGGIGKTTLAVAFAYDDAGTRPSDKVFVDLGAVDDPSLVAASIAAVLGLAVQSRDPLPSIVARLGARETLLILDSVEHLISAAAEIAERLVAEALTLRLLVTSREALRVDGEHVYPLEPLEQPSTADITCLTTVLDSPAGQLLVERTKASDDQLEFTDKDAPQLAAICRRLDGIPLALELAAGIVPTFGLSGTLALLSQGLDHLKGGRRTAAQRHKSLKDALAWSYDLLDARSREIFRQLAVFVGPFRLDAAQFIAGGAPDAPGILADLVAKSLVSVRRDQGPARFRLLDTMRSFLREKLDAEEWAAASARHAAYYCLLLQREDAADGATIDDVPSIRAALVWCYAGNGENRSGTALSVRAAVLYQRLGLLSECQSICETAIAALSPDAAGSRDEMELQTCLAQALMYTSGHAPDVLAAFERALDLAADMEEPERELAIVSALHVYHNRSANFVRGLHIAERGLRIAQADPANMASGHLSLGIALHHVGRHREASSHLATAMSLSKHGAGVDRITAYATHPNRGRVILAQSLWLQGLPDQAAAVAHAAIAEAQALDHGLSLAIALSGLPSVFIWRQDWDEVERLLDRHWTLAEKHALLPYKALVLGRRGELAICTGRAQLGVIELTEALTQLAASNYLLFFTPLRLALAQGYAELGQIERALAEIDRCQSAVENDGDTMYLAELLRIKAELVATEPTRRDLAEALLHRAMAVASEQGALSWQLRAATSLARLLTRQGRSDEGCSALRAVLDRFSEGTETGDVRSAEAQLAVAMKCTTTVALSRYKSRARDRDRSVLQPGGLVDRR